MLYAKKDFRGLHDAKPVIVSPGKPLDFHMWGYNDARCRHIELRLIKKHPEAGLSIVEPEVKKGMSDEEKKAFAEKMQKAKESKKKEK